MWPVEGSSVPRPGCRSLSRIGLFFKTQLLIFSGEHGRKPQPLAEALIQGSLVCDTLVLSNSERVPIQRHVSFLGLHEFSSHQTSKACRVHFLRSEVLMGGDDSGGMVILGCQPAQDPASQLVEPIIEPRQARRAWAPVLSSRAEYTDSSFFLCSRGTMVVQSPPAPRHWANAYFRAPPYFCPYRPIDHAFPFSSGAVLTAGRWVLLSPAEPTGGGYRRL